MKYEIELKKSETRTIHCDAADRDAAVRLAERELPGFHAESIVEVLDNDTLGNEHEVVGKCEGCGAVLFDDSDYTTDPEDGIEICASCGKES